MRAIIVDDEYPAIERLISLIEEDNRLNIAATFTDALKALNYLAGNQIDVIFSDINMPEINGIHFGSKIKSLYPNIILIYITAYNEYALDAYNNFALGYLLKPISIHKLSNLINKLYSTNKSFTTKDSLIIKTLGNFSLEYNGSNISFRTKKAKELFCFLLHHKGTWVNSDNIIFSLWPNKSLNLARTNLHTTISYSRKALKNYGLDTIIEYNLGSYRINYEHIHWDYEILINKLEALNPKKISKVELFEIFQLDTGRYLGDSDYLWANQSSVFLDIQLNNLYSEQFEIIKHSHEKSDKIYDFLKLKDDYSEL